MVEVKTKIEFAVYLLQAKHDDDWVENQLAVRLSDNEGLQPYFFKWEGIPGANRLKSMADGFNKSKCCAICLGEKVLDGLEERMQELATDRQAKTPGYKLIPVFLPDSNPDSTPEFLVDLEGVDFRAGSDFDEQFHRLVCAIQDKPPGPWPPIAKGSVAPKAADLSQVNEEKYKAAFVTLVKIVSAEETGLPKEEAAEFRRNAFAKLQEQITENYLKKVIEDDGVG